MANKLFQGAVQQMRKTINRVVGVIDSTGAIVSCSDLTRIGKTFDILNPPPPGNEDCFINDIYTCRQFGLNFRSEYTLFIEGTDPAAAQICTILAISFSSIQQFYDEKYDRNSFIKNIVLDNILPGDIYVRAKELHFTPDVSRAVLIIRIPTSGEISALNVIQNLFPDKQKDFVFNVSENDIVLVKEIRDENSAKDIEKLARSIADTLSSEFFVDALIGIGTPVEGIQEVARSFKEAQISLEVGKVLDTEKSIISYDSLGIARLIYQLPTTLCKMFLQEVFKKGSVEGLDQETLFTIQKFFENNLNVSETSRKLFVHRNTLVYRLEKIRKITGLDLREFDHAIVFKVALMVKKYLTSNPVKY